MKKPSSRYRYENLVFNMRTQSKKEQKDDMWSIIEKINKFLGFYLSCAAISGGILIYLYLKPLGAISLFSEIISTPSNLISILISYTIIIIALHDIIIHIINKLKKYFKNQKNDYSLLAALWIHIGVLIIFNNSISPYLFKELGYIEKNTDARWYLLDTRFINQYGLVKKEGTMGLNDKDILKEWQIKFCKEPKIDSCIRTENYAFFQYKNAVYGYMAWNLGKTKIFCPHYVTIERTQRDKTTLDKVCLTINGDYLQPIPDDL